MTFVYAPVYIAIVVNLIWKIHPVMHVDICVLAQLIHNNIINNLTNQKTI